MLEKKDAEEVVRFCDEAIRVMAKKAVLVSRGCARPPRVAGTQVASVHSIGAARAPTSSIFFGDDQFVDGGSGDTPFATTATCRYRAMASFARVPLAASVGIIGPGNKHKPTMLPSLLR
jgi:hypothetical protein